MEKKDKDQGKDRRLKYVELPAAFRNQANEIDTKAKISQRRMEAMAKTLAKARPKTPDEFERVEALKEMIVAQAAHNEAVAGFLQYTNGFLSEVMADARAYIDGAELLDKMKDQSDTILLQIQESQEIMRIQAKKERMYKAKIAEYERDKRG